MYNPSSLEARRSLWSSEVDPKPIWLMNVQLSLCKKINRYFCFPNMQPLSFDLHDHSLWLTSLHDKKKGESGASSPCCNQSDADVSQQMKLFDIIFCIK